ncbi:probable cytochrome P450 313a4 [Stomoxys calcitrans]|uniref:probable cytochrome P450 313a4 n=1 Tax=Stomoxys calcitrans TaxID=35570 RepID=UPI0027E222A5|nr:probable cytochrome P450 313a4 [Stomoxys calcitrans]
MCKKYGSFWMSWLGPFPFLFISEPNIVRDILTSPHCVDKSLVYKGVANANGEGLFSISDPKWSIHRKSLNPAFGHSVLLSFIPIFNEEADKLSTIFRSKKECRDIISVLQDFTLNTTTRTTMGLSTTSNLRSGDNKTFLNHFKCVTKCTTEMIFSPWLAFDFIRKLLGVYEPFQMAKTFIHQYAEKIIDEKLVSDEIIDLPDGGKHIFINQAIDLMKRGIFTRQNVKHESNVVIAAAFDTTANTISYALILLAMHPEYQQKLFEELVSIFPDQGNFEVSYDNIQDLVYMDMVLNETMRVLSPVPLVARQVTKDVKLSNGVVLPAGLQVCIDIYNMHCRKDIWGPNADLFNPDNFLPSNMEGVHPYAFIPFTKGLRNCIGWKYATLSIKVVLSKLLRNFRFYTDFKYEDLEHIESVTLRLKHVPVLSIYERDS